ncbi:MAG: Ig-like domain-containing protein [Leptospiraceae bacterium]|nr:Ig-like domain-containing protein [Leptospiraceae bacterium]
MKRDAFKKISGMILVGLIASTCKESRGANAIAQILPLALQGASNKKSNAPTASVQSDNPGTGDTVLLTASNSVASCIDAAVEPPIGFGDKGPEVFLKACSFDNVNRYSNLEFQFSEPMDTATVQANFSIVGSAALPGPAPGGVFIWKSPQRLIFDPYRELTPSQIYTVSINSNAKTTDNVSLNSFTKQFTASHDYLISSTITQGGNTYSTGGNNDLTYNKSGDLILNSSFTNSTGAFNQITKIVFNKMGNVDSDGFPNSTAKTICNGNCSSLGTPINLNTDSALQDAKTRLTEGGNTYYFEITTKLGTRIQRYIGFNWGDLNTNPTGLINNVAGGVLDQAQMLLLLKRLVELFSQDEFRVMDGPTPRTFNQFASIPTSSTKNTTNCINYGTFNFITSYGDNGTGGYCGGTGENPGAYQAVTGAGCFGNSTLDMDVYVSAINIPAFSGPNPTVNASLGVNGNGELGLDLVGRKATLTLEIIARNRDSLLCLVGSGNRFHFRTTVELNASGNYTQRLSRSRNSLAVDGSGNIDLTVKTPYTPADSISGNFYVDPWVQNLNVAGVDLIQSTSWVASLVSPLTEAIANGVVPQVKPAITQSVLGSIIQTIAPNVLNGVLQTLNNPGVVIRLPSYLPAPLADYPLVAKVRLATDAQVRDDGTNKGIVASVHASITSQTPHASPRAHANSASCNTGCMVVTKNPSVALNTPSTSAPFAESASNPGFLLTMHSDAVTQAAYNMWRNRVIDLNVDNAFITSINNYSGGDPLLTLTNSLLKVSSIMSIIAPGRSSLPGLDSFNNLLPAVCPNDDVRFKIEPINAPVTKMIDNSSFNPGSPSSSLTEPNINATFTELQLTVEGRRTDNSTNCVALRGAPTNAYYTLSTVRVGLNASAGFKFANFDNPSTGPNDYLNSLSLKIFTNGMAYSLEVLEGPTNNPYALDPQGVKTVLDSLVTTLVVPLINSILNRIPLPDQIDFAALRYPASTTMCKVSAKTDNAIELISKSVPVVDRVNNPYLYAVVSLKGSSATDPKFLLETNCR